MEDTTTMVLRLLAKNTEESLVDLNDWAVNTLREFCLLMGYNPVAVVQAEALIIQGEDLTLDEYKRYRRIGSHFRLQRRIRAAVWAVVATRKRLRS